MNKCFRGKIMDDYVTIYECVSDEIREYSTATNVSTQEHETLIIGPKEENQQTQTDQKSTGVNAQGCKKYTKKLEKAGFSLTAVVLAVILLVSLVAIVLSSVSYNTSSSSKNKVPLQLSAYRISYLRDIYELFMELNEIKNYITSITTTVEANLSKLFDAFNRLGASIEGEVTQLHCGAGVWYRAAYLNMSNSSQQCPSSWREFTSSNIKVCGRANSQFGSCSSTLFPIPA